MTIKPRIPASPPKGYVLDEGGEFWLCPWCGAVDDADGFDVVGMQEMRIVTADAVYDIGDACECLACHEMVVPICVSDDRCELPLFTGRDVG